MSPAESTYRADFRSGFRATLTVSLAGFRCEWSPDLPRTLKAPDRDALLEAYRTWRDVCLRDFARKHRLSVRTIRIDNSIDAIAFGPERPA
jgi:hypothetical protein